jgi:hypothetical protein
MRICWRKISPKANALVSHTSPYVFIKQIIAPSAFAVRRRQAEVGADHLATSPDESGHPVSVSATSITPNRGFQAKSNRRSLPI